MKLASVLTPLSETNLRLASQCGVEGIVIRYPGLTLEELSAAKRHPERFGLQVFATLGIDIPQTIRRLGHHIQYVHFRDAKGTAEAFTETFHDNGPTDMAAAIRALREIGFSGPIRPDHVPQLEGEDHGEPGYTMLGRLFAFGYIRGLIHGTA